MKPIENWELVNEAGEFKRLPAGIYPIKITNVVDVPENEYLEVYCDIVKGEFTNYFKALVDAGLKDSSKTIRSYKMNALPFFKGFITAIEKSNTGYKWDWDEKKLVGKFAVGVFGEEEYQDKNGDIKVSTKLIEVRSIEAWKEGKLKVPELKKLYVDTPTFENKETSQNLDKIEITDDELPF